MIFSNLVRKNLFTIKNFVASNRKPILIFTITFLAELLVIFILIRINGTEIFFRGDGQDYQNLANNLINHQMLAITPLPPYWPTSFRTPIYPFWLVFIYLIFRSYNAAIFIGAFVFALSAPRPFNQRRPLVHHAAYPIVRVKPASLASEVFLTLLAPVHRFFMVAK